MFVCLDLMPSFKKIFFLIFVNEKKNKSAISKTFSILLFLKKYLDQYLFFLSYFGMFQNKPS